MHPCILTCTHFRTIYKGLSFGNHWCMCISFFSCLTLPWHTKNLTYDFCKISFSKIKAHLENKIKGITNESKLKTSFWRRALLERAKQVFWKPVCKCKCKTLSKPNHIAILSTAFHFAPKSPRETTYLLMVNAWLLASVALTHHCSVRHLSYVRTNRRRCRQCFSVPTDAHSCSRHSAPHRIICFAFLAFLPRWAVSAWACYVCLWANTLFTQTIQA